MKWEDFRPSNKKEWAIVIVFVIGVGLAIDEAFMQNIPFARFLLVMCLLLAIIALLSPAGQD